MVGAKALDTPYGAALDCASLLNSGNNNDDCCAHAFFKRTHSAVIRVSSSSVL